MQRYELIDMPNIRQTSILMSVFGTPKSNQTQWIPLRSPGLVITPQTIPIPNVLIHVLGS